MKRLLIVLTVCTSLVAEAAQFKPTEGGNVDDSNNWTGTGTLAVLKQLTGPLTLSTSRATLPSGATSFVFYTYTNTCAFGANNVLNLGTVPLQVEHGGGMILSSGKITGPVYVQESFASTTQYNPGTLILDGSDSVLEPSEFGIRCYKCATSPKDNRLVVTNGATLDMTGLTFNMYGGFNAGQALFTGKDSTLLAGDVYLGSRWEADPTYRGWEDQPGVQRSVEFANSATGAISGSVFIGDVSGGNTFKVSDGATVAVAKSVYFSPVNNDSGLYGGCTNNSLVVDGGTLNIASDIMTGRTASFTGSRISVTDGGRICITGTGDGHALQVGTGADGDRMTVEGENSLVSLPNAKLFVGGRAAVSSGNRVTVKDGGKIETGLDTYLGLLYGSDNRLELSNGSTYTNTANFYIYGPANALAVASSTFGVAGSVVLGERAVGSSIALGPDATFSADSLQAKAPLSLSATGTTFNVKGLAFAAGSSISLTNSTITLTKDVKNGGGFGCTDGVLALHAGSVMNVNYRWSMVGTNFTIRVDDSTLDASGIASDWFITGLSATDGERTFVFEGARPYLKTAGKGFYLRGSAINLEFNLGKDGFPTDRAVVDVQGSGKFAADSKSANLVSVNVGGACPEGTYALMSGTDAGKFLNADRYVLTCARECKAELIREDNAVKVRVRRRKGFAVVLR